MLSNRPEINEKKLEPSALPKKLPDDAWNLIAGCAGLPSVTTLPVVCTDSKTAFYDDDLWKKNCKSHFPLTVFSCPAEDEKISWLDRFKKLELEHYPSEKRTRNFFRAVKEGVLPDIQEIKPTLDELNKTENTLKRWLPSEFFHTPMTWANKLDRQDILDYFYQVAHVTLAPDKKDSREYDLISYLVMCNQTEKFQKWLEENASLMGERGLSLFKLSIISGSKNIFPLLVHYFPHLSHTPIYFGLFPIHMATFLGHTELVIHLINQGIDVNQRGFNDSTPLILAAQGGNLELVKFFLEQKADVNALLSYEGSALIVAAQNGYLDICQLLIANGANINQVTDGGYSALFLACREGHVEIAELLLQHGANPKQAVKECGSFPLSVASWRGYVDIVDLLLEKGGDVNQTREDHVSALYIAAQNGYFKTAERLLVAGGDPNKIAKNNGTPIAIAAQKGNFAMIQLLEKKSANLHSGNSVLFAAASGGKLDMVNYLYSRGLKIDQIKEPEQVTALFIAAQNGHLDVVKFLLAHGADPKISKKDGTSPLRIAKLNEHEDIVTLLRKALEPQGPESKKIQDEGQPHSLLLSGEEAIFNFSFSFFEKESKGRVKVHFFNKKGLEILNGDQTNVSHALIRNLDRIEFLAAIKSTSAACRMVFDVEVEQIKTLFGPLQLKIDLNSILKREGMDLGIEIKSSAPKSTS